jgi:hypothetical protein
MFLLSIIINDNIGIKILHFVLIIIIIILNILLSYLKNKKYLPIIYVSLLTLWGIIRITFYTERILTHTPLLCIMLALSLIIIFPKKYKNYFYIINFIILSISFYSVSSSDFIPYLIAYLSVFLISYFINSHFYQAYIESYENKKNVKIYENKLESELKNREKNLNEINNTYSKILDFLLKADLVNFNIEYDFLKSTFKLFFNLLPEADYGSIYIIENKKVKYIDAIGHDINILKSYYYDADIFEIGSEEIEIITDIQNKFLSTGIIPEHIIAFKKATKTIKSTLVFHIKIKNNKKVCLAFDIKKNSPLEFSNISKLTMKAFNNVIKDYYQSEELYKLKKSRNTDITQSLTNLLEIHDKYTKGH